MWTLKDIIDNILETLHNPVYDCGKYTCSSCVKRDFCYVESVLISVDNIDRY